MARTHLTPSGPFAAVPFSPAVRVGDLVFVSGQLGLGADGRPEPGGVGPETGAALAAMSELLEQAGASLADVTKTLVFLVDWSDFADFNDAYRKVFTSDPPARSTVAVSELALGARVEIEAVAVIGDGP